MEIEDPARNLTNDFWKGFCAFVKYFYPKEQHGITDNNSDQHEEAVSSSFSLLLTIGGQVATNLFHENGLDDYNIFQFKLLLSKIEELCLEKFITVYENYKQSLDISKIDNHFQTSSNLTVSHPDSNDADWLEKCEITRHNLLPMEIGNFEQQQFSVLVSSEAAAVLAEIKQEEKDEEINVEKISTAGARHAGIETTDILGTNIDNLNSSFLDETNQFPNEVKSDQRKVSKSTEKGLDLNPNDSTVRRSSRQIRVSTRFADSKIDIQNLLKPVVVNFNTNNEIDGLVSKPPCLCSLCMKVFPDSKELLTHWNSHRQNKNKKKDRLPFLCQACDCKFANYSQLKTHFKCHDKTKTTRDKKSRSSRDNSVDSDSEKDKRNVTERDSKLVEQLTFKHEEEIKEAVLQCSKSNQSCASKKDLENSEKDVCANANEESKNFKCQQCEKNFDDRKSLLKHQRVHVGVENAQSKMDSSSLVNYHSSKRLYRRVGHYKCKYCNKSFKYERQLDAHTTFHTGEKPHICEICGHGFRLKRSLFHHKLLHNESSILKCEFCPKTFIDKRNFEQHKLVHSGVKPYSCEICGKGFRRLLGLKNHSRLHNKDEAFKCDECDKTFVDKWGMIKHKSVHSGEKPFECAHCGKRFRIKKGWMDHVKLHDKGTHLKCSLCPRTFIEKRKLDLHLLAHKGEKPFICDKCGKSFMNAMNLKVHNRCHTGEKPYKCSFCDKTFNQQGSHIAHERHHKGERPYICEICGDNYITKSQLTIHRRKHFNDRPYKCDQCDYAGYTGSLLKIHKIKHSEEKPFKCNLCPSAFKRPHHLEVHSKTHMTNNVVKTTSNTETIELIIHRCNYCNQCFDSQEALSAHIDTHEIVVVTETTVNNDDIFIDQGPEQVAYNIVLL